MRLATTTSSFTAAPCTALETRVVAIYLVQTMYQISPDPLFAYPGLSHLLACMLPLHISSHNKVDIKDVRLYPTMESYELFGTPCIH
jgi:hypothetical protein